MPNWSWVVMVTGIIIVTSFAFGGIKPQDNMAKQNNTLSTVSKNNQNKVPDVVLQSYIRDSMEVLDLKASMHDSVLDGKVPGVEFRVRNNGDKPIKKVEVTVYFKDKDNKIIHEQKYTPVSITGFDAGNILKPNYIWQIEHGKFYNAKSVPSEWSAGSVEAKITSIEFAEDKDMVAYMAPNSPEKQYAQNMIEIYDLKAEVHQSILDGATPGILFKIKNKGDKNLSEVVVTAYFKDKAGKVIYEQKYNPISSKSYDGAKELKAEQIWQIERGKFYKAVSLPQEWDGSSVLMEVTNIKFQ